MKIALNLLENSHDYLQESVRYFVIADEFGTHEEKSSSYSNKIKWKMAYVTLVQAFELLVKELLKSIAPILIYDDIDKPINNNSKTVSGTKGVDRLYNCEVKIMSKDMVGFVKECIAKRNAFIHYDVGIDSTIIKPSYCKLFELYVRIHKELLPDKAEFENMLKVQCHFYENILQFAKGYVIFRNEEMLPANYKEFLKDIALNKYHGIFTDESGQEFNRIPYGNEPGYNSENMRTYCPDCTAAMGEYHYEHCDIEICPKCGGQLLSCNCNLTLKTDILE